MSNRVVPDNEFKFKREIETRVYRLEQQLVLSDPNAPPVGVAGGVLSGSYPNPGFAEDMATQGELNAHASLGVTAHGGIVADTDPRLTNSRPPIGTAAGDLAGSYPDPTIKSSVGLTGNPTVPTQPTSDNSTRMASTAFVKSAIATVTSLPPSGPAGGGLGGTYPNPTVVSASGGFSVANTLTIGGDATISRSAVNTIRIGSILEVGGTSIVFNGLTNSVTLPANSLPGSVLTDNSIPASKIGFVYGGGNMVYNSSFEAAPVTDADPTTGAIQPWDGWVTIGAPTISAVTRTTDPARVWGLGDNAVKLTSTITGQNVGIAQSSLPNRMMPVQEGQTYTASGYMGADAAGRWGYVEVSYRDAAGTQVGALVSGPQTALSSTQMTRPQLVYTVPAGTGIRQVQLRAIFQGTEIVAGDSFYVDGLQNELGGAPSAYAPRSDEILPGSITATMIQAGAIYADAITANFTITGKRIQTDVSPNARVVLEGENDLPVAGDQRGLKIFDSTNVKRIDLDGLNGLRIFDSLGVQGLQSSAGGLVTGVGAERAELLKDGLTLYADNAQSIKLDATTGMMFLGTPLSGSWLQVDPTGMVGYSPVLAGGSTFTMVLGTSSLIFTHPDTDASMYVGVDGFTVTDSSGDQFLNALADTGTMIIGDSSETSAGWLALTAGGLRGWFRPTGFPPANTMRLGDSWLIFDHHSTLAETTLDTSGIYIKNAAGALFYSANSDTGVVRVGTLTAQRVEATDLGEMKLYDSNNILGLSMLGSGLVTIRPDSFVSGGRPVVGGTTEILPERTVLWNRPDAFGVASPLARMKGWNQTGGGNSAGNYFEIELTDEAATPRKVALSLLMRGPNSAVQANAEGSVVQVINSLGSSSFPKIPTAGDVRIVAGRVVGTTGAKDFDLGFAASATNSTYTVTRTGVGSYTVTMSTALLNYAVTVSPSGSGAISHKATVLSSTQFSVGIYDSITGGQLDRDWNFQVIGYVS